MVWLLSIRHFDDRRVGTAVLDEAELVVEASASRKRIIDVAYDLFLAHGYSSVSMNQIAAAAQIKKPTLYHHFRDKEDLFVAIMLSGFERSRAELVEIMSSAPTLREQLHIVAVHVFSSAHSDFSRLVVDLHEQVSQERRDEVLRQYSPPWKCIEPAIRAGIESGELRAVDAEMVSLTIFAAIWGHVKLVRAGTYDTPLDDEYAARLVNMLMDGIGTCPPRKTDD